MYEFLQDPQKFGVIGLRDRVISALAQAQASVNLAALNERIAALETAIGSLQIQTLSSGRWKMPPGERVFMRAANLLEEVADAAEMPELKTLANELRATHQDLISCKSFDHVVPLSPGTT